MTIGCTNALQMELTNLGSDTQLSHQMVKYVECSTWKERFGTKTSWSGGILHKDYLKASSQQAQEYLDTRPGSGQDGHKTPVVKNTLQWQEVYVVDSNEEVMGRFIRM